MSFTLVRRLFCVALSEGGVDYVVVGGVAVAAQGYGAIHQGSGYHLRHRSQANLEALGEVLIAQQKLACEAFRRTFPSSRTGVR